MNDLNSYVKELIVEYEKESMLMGMAVRVSGPNYKGMARAIVFGGEIILTDNDGIEIISESFRGSIIRITSRDIGHFSMMDKKDIIGVSYFYKGRCNILWTKSNVSIEFAKLLENVEMSPDEIMLYLLME